MSKTPVGKILQLFISIKDDEGITKTIEQNTITLDENGVLGDKFYSKDPHRSILLSSIESYALAQKEGIIMPYGSLGENILMDFNPYDLDVGDRLNLGTVTLEITQNCTLCKGLSKVDAKAPKLLKEHRGIFAKAITNGSLSNEDCVYI